jgi:hypothetical protein
MAAGLAFGKAPELADSEHSAILSTLMKRYPVLATRISQSRDRDGRFDTATPLWGREAEAALTLMLAAHRMTGLH